ncbi:MAG: hypothetical protein R3B57_06460 [Phycisphaerales bacterium]
MRAAPLASIVLLAGLASGARAQGATPASRTLKAWPVANIYWNLRTGERLAMPWGARPRDTASPLWINNNTDPCGTGGTVGIMDNPDADGDGEADLVFGGVPTVCDAMPTFPCEGQWRNWWGDVPHDSVVSCVVIAYGILAPDTDTDLDSIGDGIVGYNLSITFSDNDDGFGADGAGVSGRSCILDLTLSTIPGALPGLPEGYLAVYTITLDFASLAPSLIFELGDSDGIDNTPGMTGISGGSEYGHPTFGDRDADGLNDFSYALRFDQSSLPVPGEGPGRTKGANGFLHVAPAGCTASPCPAPTDPPGLDNASDIYVTGPSCPPTITSYVGAFFFSWSCATGSPAFDSSYLELYDVSDICDCCVPPGACNAADLALPTGVLNFDDALAFLVDFGSNGFCSDLADPFGVWSFSDVLAFLTVFGMGCP